MKDIHNFLIKKLKEKHIVDNILKYYYYNDWEETEFKNLKKRLYQLNKSYCPFPYNRSSEYIKDEIEKVEGKLTILKYKVISKYEQIGNNN